jgi:hypothetical protein
MGFPCVPTVVEAECERIFMTGKYIYTSIYHPCTTHTGMLTC